MCIFFSEIFDSKDGCHQERQERSCRQCSSCCCTVAKSQTGTLGGQGHTSAGHTEKKQLKILLQEWHQNHAEQDQTDISEINEDSFQASCREENGYSKGQDKK